MTGSLRQFLFTASVIGLVAACTVLPEQVPVDLYQLPAPVVERSAAGPSLPALRIARPLSSEALGGNRLLIMTADNQLQAVAGMRLAGPLPLLWRDWLLDGFGRDGRVPGLSASSAGLEAELELSGMLRAFYIDATGSQPEAVIQFDATLISRAQRRVIANRRFEARQPMPAVTPPDAVSALGAAANDLLPELIRWTVTQGQD
ncbi:MAG: hypothetical protein PsegKO_28510 [Pseudohongiellaceae bacterium]